MENVYNFDEHRSPAESEVEPSTDEALEFPVDFGAQILASVTSQRHALMRQLEQEGRGPDTEIIQFPGAGNDPGWTHLPNL